MTSPLISVIVPCYNVERYLKDCLDSIIDQTYKNIEIICVNDGSTDTTLQILNDYALKDDRIKVLSQRNLGLSAARNAGTKVASGKYITYVDSDDYLVDTMIEDCVCIAEKDEFDVVNSVPIAFCLDGSISDEQIHSINKRTLENFSIERYVDLEKDLEIPKSAWGRLINLDWLRRKSIDFPDGLLYEDIYFWWSMYLEHPKVGFSLKHGYNYRLRKDSIMRESEDVLNYSKARHHLLNWEKLLKRMEVKRQISENLIILVRLLSYYGWYTRRYSPVEYRQMEQDYEKSLLSKLYTLEQLEKET